MTAADRASFGEAVIRKLILGVLYVAVAGLVSLPPLYFLAGNGPDNWFTPAAMMLWALPLLAAGALTLLIFRLRG